MLSITTVMDESVLRLLTIANVLLEVFLCNHSATFLLLRMGFKALSVAPEMNLFCKIV